MASPRAAEIVDSSQHVSDLVSTKSGIDADLIIPL
jgi:hypothetical protein